MAIVSLFHILVNIEKPLSNKQSKNLSSPQLIAMLQRKQEVILGIPISCYRQVLLVVARIFQAACLSPFLQLH